jgi:predicted molibdopterin-dependent oxidoreductase YjgC
MRDSPAMSPQQPLIPLRRAVEISIDGDPVRVPENATILDACRIKGTSVPTLCFLETLHPVNACRVCVVEVEGARVLAPACSRKVEPGMKVLTDSPRVRHSRRLVLELLASSVDLSTTPEVGEWISHYGCEPSRFGPSAAAHEHHHARHVEQAGHHTPPAAGEAASVAQPVKIDNELYVRDYGKCILCYKCVEACGSDHQNTFAISIAGRGFAARVATEFDVPLPDSACVYCGNCIAVCPTGALMFTSEFEMRKAGRWDESRQEITDTICPYCGVGCTLRLHVQDGAIVKASSPLDHSVTLGNLCVKGRFGWRFVHGTASEPT